jgi:hypothetical protein
VLSAGLAEVLLSADLALFLTALALRGLVLELDVARVFFAGPGGVRHAHGMQGHRPHREQLQSHARR